MHGLSEGVMRRIMPEAWDAPPGVGNTIHSVVTERSVVAERARPLMECVMRRIMPKTWDAPPGAGNTIRSVVA